MENIFGLKGFIERGVRWIPSKNIDKLLNLMENYI
jgi:hypothetical protein